ncbi:MAG: hypothetical protein ACXVFD_09350 [Gaiellaceae bacterium]
MKTLIAAAAALVFATVSLAASSPPYFHHPELVAKAMERYYSNRRFEGSWAIAWPMRRRASSRNNPWLT